MLQIGEWKVDPALDEIRRGDELVKLEPRMTRLLLCLAEQPGKVFSADELLEKVWPGVIVNPSSVYQVIALLRRNLGDEGEDPRYIATVPRKGYRLVAPVTQVVEPTSAPEAAVTPPEPRPSHRLRWALAATAIVALSAIYFGTRSDKPPVANRLPPSLVVLPLTDLSADGSNGAFCDGLTEELVNSLGRVAGLRVMGRTSATRAREDRIETREMGRLLGVTHVLEGSVRVTKGRLRVSAQLVSTADGFQVWSNSFDRPRSEAIQIQTEIARSVVDSLAIQLTSAQGERLGRAPTRAVNAYELYLLGRYNQLQRTPDSARRALDYQKQAVAADPKFALARAGLADAHMLGVRYLNRDLSEAIALAQPEVDEALRLDPELAEGYVSWGIILLDQWDNLAARKAFQKALAINPNYGMAMYGLGISYEWNLEVRESLDVYQQAVALDPLNPQIHVSICNASYLLGRYAAAGKACLRANELQPEVPNSLVTYSELAQFQGDLANAIERMTQALARSPARFDLRTRLGVLYLDAGLPGRASVEFAKARDDGADAALRTSHLYAMAANGDRAALTRALHDTDWQAVPAAARVDGAYLARIAKDAALATALLDSVRTELQKTAETLQPGYYPLRLGSCELCSLVVLERATGHADSAAPRERLMLNTFAEHEANGLKVGAVEYYRALFSASHGETDAALRSLERAVELGWRRAWLMRIDPALETLRDQSRFTAVLRRIEDANARTRAELDSRASKFGAHPIP